MPKYVTASLVSSLVLLCAQAHAEQPYPQVPGVSGLPVPSLSVIEPQPSQGAVVPGAQQDVLPCAAVGDSQPYVNEYGQIERARPLSILDCI